MYHDAIVRTIMHNETDPFHVDYQIAEIRTMVSPLYDSTATTSIVVVTFGFKIKYSHPVLY